MSDIEVTIEVCRWDDDNKQFNYFQKIKVADGDKIRLDQVGDGWMLAVGNDPRCVKELHVVCGDYLNLEQLEEQVFDALLKAHDEEEDNG